MPKYNYIQKVQGLKEGHHYKPAVSLGRFHKSNPTQTQDPECRGIRRTKPT
jgi:hypothetical protein